MDVAEEAGVSAITVSRALRTPKQVRAETRSKIDAAIAKLNYVPDPAASALASMRSNVIGVMIPSVTNTVFLDTMRGIYDVAEGKGVQVQITNTRYDPEEEERLLRVVLSQRPAALIVTGVDQSETVAAMLRDAPCPVVQIIETGPEPYDMMVGFDHRAAARAATEHLIAQGYQRPAYLGARHDPRSTRRLEGFRMAAEAAGCFDPTRVLYADTPSSATLGPQQLAELLSRNPQADAALCNNDEVALGLLFECHRRGLEVPTRFGICGYNDTAAMAIAHPSITSVRTPRYEIGRLAMQMILDRLQGRAPADAVIDLGFELIERDSTRRV